MILSLFISGCFLDNKLPSVRGAPDFIFPPCIVFHGEGDNRSQLVKIGGLPGIPENMTLEVESERLGPEGKCFWFNFTTQERVSEPFDMEIDPDEPLFCMTATNWSDLLGFARVWLRHKMKKSWKNFQKGVKSWALGPA